MGPQFFDHAKSALAMFSCNLFQVVPMRGRYQNSGALPSGWMDPMAFGWLATSLIFGTLPHENHGNLHYSAVNMKSGSLCEFTACKKQV